LAVFPEPYEEYVASLLHRRPDVEYVVQRGDSLAGIARSAGATVAALKAENGLKGNVIHPGDRLRIPSGSVETYRVQSGDSLHAIARLFDTTVAALSSVNALRGDLIFAGQVLLVTTQ
jgi:D-gamma-glutamyl-meso-diaminopimelic acid endopeptidase CwlS/peptidoglycan endopeptidase LytE